MSIVNDRHSSSKPTQVDPKTGKPLPATTQPPRSASPSIDLGDSNTGFFGSFFASKNKKKMAAMDAPPPTLKASGTLSERENTEVEVISKFQSRVYPPRRCVLTGFRTSNQLVLQHRQENHDRYGSKGHHAESRPVRLDPLFLVHDSMLMQLSRFTKEEMQRELLNNMYLNDELDDLLRESEYTIRRRKECQQMVDSLAKASEIVSQVQ